MAYTVSTQPEFVTLTAPEGSPFATVHDGVPLGNVFTSRQGSFAYVHDMETWSKQFPSLPHLALKESHAGFVESELVVNDSDDDYWAKEYGLSESRPLLAGYLGDRVPSNDADVQGTYRHICDEWNALVQSDGAGGHSPRVYAFGYVKRLDIAHPAIVMDWVGDAGETPLYRYLGSSVGTYGMGLDARRAAHAVRSICEALRPLHRRHMCHRDLKPDNVLISPDGSSASIVDLGQAWSTNGVFVDNHLTVSQEYGAPEMFASAGEELFSYRASEWCDVWSLGAILWYLRVGKDPDVPAHPKDKQALSLPTELINDIDDLRLSSVINWCTCRSPRARPTVSAVAIMLSLIESGKAPGTDAHHGMRVLPTEEAMTVLESQPNIIAHGIRLSVSTETTRRLGELDSFGFKEFEAVNMPTSGKSQSTANVVLGPTASSVLFSHDDGDNPHVVVTLGEKDRLMRDILYVCRLKRDPLEVAPSNPMILPHLIFMLQGASRRIGEPWRYHPNSSQPDFYSSEGFITLNDDGAVLL